MLSLRPAYRIHVSVHHRGQHLQPRPDGHRQQALLHIDGYLSQHDPRIDPASLPQVPGVQLLSVAAGSIPGAGMTYTASGSTGVLAVVAFFW